MDVIEPIAIPIDGTLDLHTFQPSEVAALVADYIAECRRRNILEIRIVHGKGTGALRRTVHAALQELPEVLSFHLADESAGSWGATLVNLKPSGTTSCDPEPYTYLPQNPELSK
jgi:DNA-nicking Smr family endonuclease